MKLSAREMIATALFSSLMIAGAFIRIPFPLLPVTLQTFICALAGLILGPKLAPLSMTLYMLLGLAGLPVFAGGGGITYIFSNSFGFILGFIAGSFVIGKLSQKPLIPQKQQNSFCNSILSLFAGLFVIYVAGILYMFLIIRLYLGNTDVSMIFLVYANLPYLIKDALLFSAAALVAPSMVPSIRRSLQ